MPEQTLNWLGLSTIMAPPKVGMGVRNQQLFAIRRQCWHEEQPAHFRSVQQRGPSRLVSALVTAPEPPLRQRSVHGVAQHQPSLALVVVQQLLPYEGAPVGLGLAEGCGMCAATAVAWLLPHPVAPSFAFGAVQS